MASGWFGARTVERDLPQNMREMGDSTELAYSCPSIRQQRQAQYRKEELAYRVVSLSYLSLTLT
jgi:hypothetical protein